MNHRRSCAGAMTRRPTAEWWSVQPVSIVPDARSARPSGAAELIYHGLIKVGTGLPTICWLRLYARRRERIAVLTEVPGNPGTSVTNGLETLIDWICRVHAVERSRLTVFEIWPIGAATMTSPRVSRVRLAPALRWEPASRGNIEALVGGPLSELPDHDHLYPMVRSLGGGRLCEPERELFEALPVDRLPPPHNPSRCDHYPRFERIERQLQKRRGQKTFAVTLEAGREFVASLTAADASHCRLHQGNWKVIADASARIVDKLGECEPEVYVAEAKGARLPTRDRDILISLFTDPIVVLGGSFNNGQHRSCGARLSGADRVAVVIGYRALEPYYDDWVYGGGG